MTVINTPLLLSLLLPATFTILASLSAEGGNRKCTGNSGSDVDVRKVYKLGVLFTVQTGTFRGHKIKNPAYYLGAIPYTIDYLNNGLLCNENFKLAFWAEDIMGKVKKSLKVMTNNLDDTVAFVGPEKECYVEAYYAAAWNKPIITYNCQDSKIPDPSIFTSFARTLTSTSTISKYVISLLNHYKWTKFTLVYQNSVKWRGAADALQKESETSGLDMQDKKDFPAKFVPVATDNNTRSLFWGILTETQKRTRIYVFFGEYDALIDFVRNMYRMGSVEGYVVIALRDSVAGKQATDEYFTYMMWQGRVDQIMVDTMKVVLLLQPIQHGSQSYKHVVNEAAKHSIKAPFNVPRLHNYTIDFTKPKTAVYAAYLYDAVYLLALSIKATLAADGDVYNGTQLTATMRRQKYTSILDDEMKLTEHGDTQHIYYLYSLKTDEGSLHGKSFQVVGNFSHKDGPTAIPQFYEYPHNPIQWVGNGPPLNEPKCGFDGSKCHWPIAISCVAVVSIIIIGFVYGCRHYIYEQKLARLLWKIEYMELLMAEPEVDPAMSEKLKHKEYEHMSYCTSFSKGSVMKDRVVTNNPTFMTIASYKGNLVVVKGYRKRHVEINREVKKELHYIKELSHDNINRFIGACLDQPTLCIVTQYCARGSLKDILENDDLPLDDMFTASLIFDLIKGMIFLHDSEIVWHGNLKPSNCLVDSRWVLQISDFGLHFLRSLNIPKKKKVPTATLR